MTPKRRLRNGADSATAAAAVRVNGSRSLRVGLGLREDGWDGEE